MDGSPDLSELSLDQLVELEARAAARDAEEGAEDDGLDVHDEDDGIVVLPWYQNPINIITMVVTSALVAGMIGWLIGDAQSRVSHNEVDTGFLQDMRVHHEQAVFMSGLYRDLPETDPGLGTIAYSIMVGQSIEVGSMIQLLRDFGEEEARPNSEASMGWMGMLANPGQMPGLASDDDIERLTSSSGREADLLFVELMTEHHLGGIEMADYAAEHGENDEVTQLAASMAGAQRAEIREMLDRLD